MVKYYDFTLRCLDSEALRFLQHWGKDAVEVMGDVIYSIPMPEKGYRTGIIFHEPGGDTAKLFSNKP
jgi:hypothetical protein